MVEALFDDCVVKELIDDAPVGEASIGGVLS